jgi:hypothetical protein
MFSGIPYNSQRTFLTIPASTQANQPSDSDAIMMEAPDSPPHISSQNLPPTFSQIKPNQSNQSAARVNGDGTGAKANFGAPGSSWNNKKFAEEHQRAYEMQTDKDWDPGELL